MAEFFNRQWRLPNEENKNKQSNYSLQKTSGAQRINISSPAPVGITSSFSFWLKREDTAASPLVYKVVGTASYGFYIVGTSTLYVRYGGAYIQINNTATQNALALTDWVHWVVTRQEVTSTTQDIRLYANGTLIYSLNGTSSLGTLDSKVDSLMYSLGTLDSMDSFSIFDYVLSQSQVTTLHGSSSTGIGNPQSITPKPVATYNLGDQDAFNGADYLVPNAALQDYVFGFAQPMNFSTATTNTPITAQNKGSIFSGVSNFTFSGWFNIPYYTYFLAFDFRDGNNIYFNINMFGNQLRFNIGAGNAHIANFQNIVPVNTWFHYTGVFDGSGASDTDRLKLYIDGEPQTVVYGATTPTSFPTIPSTADISLGKFYSVLTYTTMLSSNIQLWDSSLTPSEVQTVYNNGSPLQTLSNVPQNSNLELWWKLNATATFDGSNWSIPDDSSNSNTGTSSGMTQSALQQSDLQHTSGYSPYALQLDGVNNSILLANSPIVTGVFTISMWIKRTSLTSPESAGDQYLIQKDAIGGGRVYSASFNTASGEINFYVWTSNTSRQVTTSTAINDTEWHNVVIVNNGDTINNQVYLDGAEASYTTQETGVSTLNSLNIELRLGGSSFYAPANFYGSMSNTSIWNTNLTSSQILEIYNSGAPSNLNNHSVVSSLVSWWQLGSNSSFNATTSQWIVLDEKGTNNGVSSTNMSEVDIVNGVGYSSNGVSTNMSDNVIGDAPYSTANSLSVNMDVLDRTTDVPS